MQKILFLFILILTITPCVANDFSLENNYKTYNNYAKFILEDLLFSEKQVFKKTYKKDKITDRLERLEIAIFGAIQDGDEYSRIKSIRKSVTNVASGGNGLQYTIGNMVGLAGNSISNFSYGLTNSNPYNNYGKRNYYSRSHYRKHYRPHCCSSHRLPPPRRYSNRVPYYNQQPTYTNGDYSQNYSLGTSIKILDD